MSDIGALGPAIQHAIHQYGVDSPRSQQSEQGILGPSDIGFCRQKAVLMTNGVPRSDSPPMMAAQVGTAVHAYVAGALRARYGGTWIVDDRRLTCTLRNGVELTGTPDIVAPDYNAVVDIKTVDGYDWVKENGPSQTHRFQRWIYATAAIQAGLLDGDKPVYVMNYYIDRSARDPNPYYVWEELDPTLEDEIVTWLDDVIYAVQHGEESARDVVAPVCKKICPYFTVCRGGLPDTSDDVQFITDPDVKAAIRMHIKAQNLAKEAAQMKRAARDVLVGVSGRDDEYQVRWVSVNETEVPGFTRRGYDKLEVVPLGRSR